jgi:mutator protein MutT
MPKIIDSVGVVVFEGEKVLLVRHEEKAAHFTGTLGQPAGKVEKGETFRQAAIRELEEETGLIADPDYFIELPTRYTATIDGKTGPRTFYHVVFLCKKFTGKLKGDEKTTPLWTEIEKIKDLTLIANVANSTFEALKFRD